MISLAAAAREILAVIEANRELDALALRWQTLTFSRTGVWPKPFRPARAAS